MIFYMRLFYFTFFFFFNLRKLRSFDADKPLLKVFYTSFIESALTFAVIWFGNLSVKKLKLAGKKL